MATTRVTISLRSDLAAKLKNKAGGGSVSAYVAEVLEGHLEDAKLERIWREFLDEVGVTAEDFAEADRVLDKLLGASTDNAA